MSVIGRGIRNAFRNTVRAISIIIILGLSLGLSLTMLIAHQAVSDKISSVKASIGNTISIQPAGFVSGSQANNALTTSQLDKVKSMPHVTSLTETLTDRLTTIGSSSFPRFGDSSAGGNNQTSLTSPITLNSDGNGSASGGGFHIMVEGGGSLPANFSPPIQIVGTTDPTELNGQTGNTATLKSGRFIDGSQNTDQAMVSTDMASKNNLQVGSTFTAYGTTLTVAGIFDSGTRGGNDSVIVSLPTEQRLSGQSGEVTSAVATVDSLDNLSATTTAIKNIIGSSADVTSSEDQANQAVQPLNNVKTISLYSLIGAVVAGSVIILLTMVMIVRERRREIGVLKAIGASNVKIMFQFMTEALTFTLLAAIIGLLIGVAGGSPVTNTLVTSSTNNSVSSPSPGPGAFRGGAGPVSLSAGGGFRRVTGKGIAGKNLNNLHANVGWGIILDGLAAAVLIAIVGSALTSFFISNIRPAEVMRVE